MIEWRPLMARWSKELMSSSLAKSVDPAPEFHDWLGFAAATSNDLDDLEKRLGVILPPSYKSFLLMSNGWRRTDFSIDRIRPAAEVNWFRVENEQWAEIYAENGSELSDEQYYTYPENEASDHRAAHMKSLLQISDVADAVLLLNPEAVTPDGEWEAWYFANWIPGAIRYPSFAHMMLRHYMTFAKGNEVNSQPQQLPKLPFPGPMVARVPAERIRKRAARAPTLEVMISQMKELKGKPLDRAVRTFCGKMKGRRRAVRRPDLVPILAELYYSAEDTAVREACIAALTELAEDFPPPAPLLDSLSDIDPGVVLQGMFALHYFPNPLALEPLCRFIESRANILYCETAMQALGKIGDERAVPSLVRMLFDTSNRFDQSFGSAAIALARCGHKGFEALRPALLHEDVRVRLAGVVGVDVSGDPCANRLLDDMESDPEPKVRERARVRMGKWLF